MSLTGTNQKEQNESKIVQKGCVYDNHAIISAVLVVCKEHTVLINNIDMLNHSNPQVIHTRPVLHLKSCKAKSCALVRNKFILFQDVFFI